MKRKEMMRKMREESDNEVIIARQENMYILIYDMYVK
jgi:hypothetical protein